MDEMTQTTDEEVRSTRRVYHTHARALQGSIWNKTTTLGSKRTTTEELPVANVTRLPKLLKLERLGNLLGFPKHGWKPFFHPANDQLEKKKNTLIPHDITK